MMSTHSKHKIPLAVSSIAAGPAAWIGEDSTLLDVSQLITKGREGYLAFRVTGRSMTDRIQPGDFVFVDTYKEPRNGDLVAAEYNGLTCVKIFQSSRNGLYLISSNKEYPPRKIVAEDGLRILGVVRGHLALYD